MRLKPRVWAPRIIRGTRLANQYANLGLGRAKECSRGSDPGSELETRERTQDEGGNERSCAETQHLLIHSSLRITHV